MKALVSIDSVDLPAPSRYSLPRFDIESEDSKRNEEGYVQRDRIRQGVYRLGLEWDSLTDAEVAIIQSAVEPASLSVTFAAPGGDQTKTMYADSISVDAVAYRSVAVRWKVKIELIEV